LFERLGGFPNQPIFEDVAFCEGFIRVTTLLLLSPPVATDAYSFFENGNLAGFSRVLLVILHGKFHLPMLPSASFQQVKYNQ
jgi:hypothetical protein